MRVAQHLDQVGVDVFDLGSISVEKQNPVSSGFKQSTVAAFGYPQRFARGITKRIGMNGKGTLHRVS